MVGVPPVILDAVAMGILRARQRLLQGFTVFSFMLLLLCVAAFLYGSFYYSYMPKAAFSTPVHYYYRTDCESPASFLCSYPVANISLLRNKKHVLTFGQVYRIYLQLEMPDSPTNHQVGMFMIKAAYFSQDGGQVAASTRSGMLRYRSDLLRTLGTLLFLPAFLSGAVEQKQVLEVELFSEYIDDPYSPSVTALIEIMSSKVQIYSSHLYVHAHFTGIRYLLFYFPVFSAFVGVFSNFIFLSFLFILSYIRQLFKVEQKPEHSRHRKKSGRDCKVLPRSPQGQMEGQEEGEVREQLRGGHRRVGEREVEWETKGGGEREGNGRGQTLEGQKLRFGEGRRGGGPESLCLFSSAAGEQHQPGDPQGAQRGNDGALHASASNPLQAAALLLHLLLLLLHQPLVRRE
uniref:Seipin n=1 Tax=Kryptolebias marmoratus TaxID=37003 RepID=A0A3Q2ZPD2_KRYMA